MKHFFLSLAMVATIACSTASADIVINEFFADDTGTDDAEFVELFVTGGMSLDGLSLIIVDGDTSGLPTSTSFRRVNEQFDFTAATVVSPDGFYVLGFGSTPNVDQTIGSSFLQNGSQTYALVRTADIAYEPTDDDQLTLASVNTITANLIDAVGYTDEASDDIYFGAADISDGSGFSIDTAQRIPNGLDTDSTSDFITQSTFVSGGGLELADTNATPGAINAIPEPTSCLVIGLLAGAAVVRRRR